MLRKFAITEGTRFESRRRSAPHRLLIVDDESAQLLTLRDIFTDEGFEVCACPTLAEAIERCREKTFAVAIVDLRLRGQDGISLLRQIKEWQPEIRTIVHTAYGSFDSAKQAIDLGVFGYVEKQGDPAELVSKVHRAAKDALSEALTQSEQRYRDLLEDVVAIVWERNLPDGRFTFVSQQASSILSYPVSRWIEEPDFWVNVVHKDDQERCVALLSECSTDGEDQEIEYRAVTADGRTVWLRDVVHVVKNADGAPTQLRGAMFDITQRRLSEQQLQDSERSLAKAQEIAHVGSWQVDFATGQVQMSAELRRIVGILEDNDDQEVFAAIEEFVHPEDQEFAASTYHAALTNGVVPPVEFRLVRRSDGEVRHVRAETELVFRDDGMPRRVVGTLQDITERKEAEIALRESEEKLRFLADKSAAIVVILQDDQFISYNGMLAAVSGYSVDELRAMPFWQIIHPDYRDLVATRYQQRLSGGDPPQRYEFKIVTKCGDERWLDGTAQLIDFEGAPAVMSTCIDVTDRKIAEEQLRQKESELAHVSRLSTMGEMVAGIAHEINQPLSAIANFAVATSNTVASEGYKYDAPVEEWLHDISEQAVRCGNIIRRLRDFVKKGDEDRQWTDLNRVVNESVALIESDIRDKPVTIDCSLPRDGTRAYVNPIQLQQVIVNLLRNACDATCDTDKPRIRIHVEGQDDGASVTIEDNGRGLEESQRQKMFDAFYTTKPDGMGMGLAISKSIVEAHGGNLRCDANHASGAKFHLELPAVTASTRST